MERLNITSGTFYTRKHRAFDHIFWIVAQIINTKNACLEYLGKYPNGKHVSSAIQKIEALLGITAADDLTRIYHFEAILARKPVDRLLWEVAKIKDTVEGYQRYLGKYPTGKFSELAKKRIQDLEGRTGGRRQF